MRLPIAIALAALLAACGAPAAQPPSPPATAAPTAPATAEPPAATPATSTPAPAATAQPTAEPPAAAQPATLGYGQAMSAAFVPGADTLAVGTTAGVLLLGLPDLATLRFLPTGGAVQELAASPDGQHLAATTYDGATASTRLLSLDGAERFAAPGTQASFSADGAYLVVSALDLDSGRYTTRVLRAGDGSEVGSAAGDRAELSPGAGVLASFDQEQLVISQVGGGELLRTPAFAVAFSPDTRFVALSGFAGVELLPLRDGAPDLAGRRALTQAPAQDLVFAEDGALLTLTEAGITRWDPASGESSAPLALDLGADQGRFGPGGGILSLSTFVGDGPGRLRLLRAGDLGEIYAGGEFAGGAASFSPDGRQAAVVDFAGVRLVDIERSALAERRLVGYSHVAFADGGAVAAGRLGPEVDLWPVEGGEAPAQTLGTYNFIRVMRELNAGGGTVIAEVEDLVLGGYVARFAAEGMTAGSGSVVVDLAGVSDQPVELPAVWDASGGQIAWIGPGAEVLLSDGGAEPRVLPALRGVPENAIPLSLKLSPDGALLAVGYNDGTLLLAQVADLLPRAAGPLGEGRPITAIAWSPDGAHLAYATAGGAVALWEAGDDDAPRRFEALSGEDLPPQLALSGSGEVLAVGSEGGLVVYRAADGAELLREALAAEDVALTPDGARVAATVDGRVVVLPLR